MFARPNTATNRMIAKRRRVAGAPLLEGLALQRDRDHLGGRARPAVGQQVHQVEHLEVLDAAEQHRQHDEGQHHRQRDAPELAPRRGAVDLGRLVDVVGDAAQAGQADQHHVGRPHPGVDDHDGPGRELHRAEHLEARRRDAGEEAHRVVEQADLRLVEEGPEVAHHRRRQHHRDQDQRGPEAVAAELAVDQVGQREADQRLQRDGPEQEVRGGLHRAPDVGVGEDRRRSGRCRRSAPRRSAGWRGSW